MTMLFRAVRASGWYGLWVVTGASAVAVAALMITAPGAAQVAASSPDEPPNADPTGPNPLGSPTLESAPVPGAPVDGQGPPEVAPDVRTVVLADGTEAVADELIVNYGENTAGAKKADFRRAAGVALKTDFREIGAEVVVLDEAADTAGELEAKKAEIEADPAVASVDYNYVVWAAWSPNDPFSGEVRRPTSGRWTR